MPVNIAAQSGQTYEALHLGFRVEKAQGATVATGETSLFTITGGRVLLTQIVGEVTTVIQTQATSVKIVYDPDSTVTAGADTDLCAVLDISADVVGLLYGITGTVADAMIEGLGRVLAQHTPHVLSEGAIHQNSSAASSGGIKWTMWYVPLDDGAVVVAA